MSHELRMDDISGSVARRHRFSTFLRSLFGDKEAWKTQAGFKTDEHVRRVCANAGNLSPLSLLRGIHRLINTGKPSRSMIERLAALFEFESQRAFLAKFAEWEATQGLAGSMPLPTNAVLQRGINNRYVLQPETVVYGEESGAYRIDSRIEGTQARSDTYRITDLESGRVVFGKLPRIDTAAKDQQVTEALEQFGTFLNRERASLRQLREVPAVARFVDIAYADLTLGTSTSRVPILLQEFVDGDMLETWIRRLHADEHGEFKGIRNGPAWIDLAKQLLTVVQNIHRANILHGDLRPSNVLVTPKGTIVLVDFGQSGIPSLARPSRRRAERGTITSEEDPYLPPERIGKEDLPNEVSADIYGLGGILLFLATGSPPPTPAINDKNALREYVSSRINPDLKRYNSGIEYVINHALQFNVLDRAADAEDLARLLNTFEQMLGHADVQPVRSLVSEAENVVRAVKSLPVGESLFTEMIRRELSHVLRRSAEMLAVKRLEVAGTRDQIVGALMDYMAALRPGDLYWTTTTPAFWRSKNLGIRGRFWQANSILAFRRVRIRRVIIVSPEDMLDSEFHPIMQAQIQLMDLLERENISTTDKEVSKTGYYAGVVLADPDEQRKLLSSGDHIGLVQNEGKTVSLSFRLDSEGVIRKLLLWNIESGNFLAEHQDATTSLIRRSEPLREWYKKYLMESTERKPHHPSKSSKTPRRSR